MAGDVSPAEMNLSPQVATGNAAAVQNERLNRAAGFGEKLLNQMKQNGAIMPIGSDKYFPTYFLEQEFGQFGKRDIGNLDIKSISERQGLSFDSASKIMEQACVRVAIKAAILGQRKKNNRSTPVGGTSEVRDPDLYEAYRIKLGQFAETTKAIIKDSPQLRTVARQVLIDCKIIAEKDQIPDERLDELIANQFVEAQKRPQEKLDALQAAELEEVKMIVEPS